MAILTDKQLENRIEDFMSRKMEEFPELQSANITTRRFSSFRDVGEASPPTRLATMWRAIHAQ